MSTRRKLAIASWRSPREGNIYGKLTVDMGAALAYVERKRTESGEKITINHLVGKAVAMGLRKAPGLNGYLRFGSYIPHERVDISFLVAIDDGADLGKAKVVDADRKSVVEIARELRERAERLRAGRDDEFNKSKGLLRMMPTWLLRPIVWLTGFLTGALGLSVKALGLEAFPFGAVIITNVGVFNLDEGYVPPTPFARVPIYVLVGAVRERPAVVDGQVVPRPQLTLTATIDHRFVDGAQGGVLAKVMREVLENPDSLDGAETKQLAS
jgi:pyruvate dehydrogenase E2 component (dihydrolipoamide acetyltransferase)